MRMRRFLLITTLYDTTENYARHGFNDVIRQTSRRARTPREWDDARCTYSDQQDKDGDAHAPIE